MYAIIEDSGTQFRVEKGQTLDIDLRDLPEGQQRIEFDRVLLVGQGENTRVGTPYVEGARVVASVVGPVKGPKIYIQKFKRRKGYRLRKGHRQKYLRVAIEDILA